MESVNGRIALISYLGKDQILTLIHNPKTGFLSTNASPILLQQSVTKSNLACGKILSSNSIPGLLSETVPKKR